MTEKTTAGYTGTAWVYSFGAAGTEGNTSMLNLLGGKGANLAEMSGIGLPVPPGSTITTEVCAYYYDNDGEYPIELEAQVEMPFCGSRLKQARILPI